MKIEIEKSYFKNRDGADKAYRYLSSIIELLSKVSKGIIFTFFTPILIVSSFFTRDFFTSIVNNSLALAQIAGLVYSTRDQESDTDDLFIAIIGIGFLTVTMFHLTGGMVTHASFLRKMMFAANLFSAAANTFFLLQEIVTPPIKILLNILFDGIHQVSGYDIRKFNIFKTVYEYNIKSHEVTLSKILRNSFDYTEDDVVNLRDKVNGKDASISEEQREKIKADIDKINTILNLLKSQQRKYSTLPLGMFIYRDELTLIQKAKDEITMEFKLSKATQLFKDYLTEARHKLGRIQKARSRISEVNHPKFDKTMMRAFIISGDLCKETKTAIRDSAMDALDAYEDEIHCRRKELNAAFPVKGLKEMPKDAATQTLEIDDVESRGRELTVTSPSKTFT